MAFSININTAQLAQTASDLTAPGGTRGPWQTLTGQNQGLAPNVILAQWTAEEPEGTTKGPTFWPSNNPAGIRPGNPYVDKNFAIGTNASGFDIFPDPLVGAEAYGYLYANDPNYTGVRAAIKTGDPQKELQAVANSPWGTNPKTLYAAYDEVTGAKLNYTTSDVLSPGSAKTALTKSVGKKATSGLNTVFGNVNWTEVLIVVAGVILIILLSYRIVTH